MFKEAKKYGNKLFVILNNDKQSIKKKGFSFMGEVERKEILEEFRCVDKVIIAIDEDSSVCKTLEDIKPYAFCNGGDRVLGNIPEVEVCKKCNIEMIFNVGGKKIESSTNLINKFNN